MTEPQIVVRPYATPDLEPLLDVWEAAFRLAHPFMEDDFIAQERRNIPEIYMPIAETWIAEVAGEVVGFLALIESEVGAIFVAPDRHGAGFGRALMDKAHALRGSLTVEVFERNPIGRAFYDRYGFKLLERKEHEPTGHMLLRMAFEPA